MQLDPGYVLGSGAGSCIWNQNSGYQTAVSILMSAPNRYYSLYYSLYYSRYIRMFVLHVTVIISYDS